MAVRVLGAVVLAVIVAAVLIGDTSWLTAIVHHAAHDLRTAWARV